MAPVLSAPKVVVSMVYHIRAKGGEFISADSSLGNQEHMFCFVSGFEKHLDLAQLLTDCITPWQDASQDRLKTSTRMTAEIFLAAFLSQHGTIFSTKLSDMRDDLEGCYSQLKKAVQALPSDATAQINQLNRRLVDSNHDLITYLSAAQFVKRSTKVLLDNIWMFQQEVRVRLE